MGSGSQEEDVCVRTPLSKTVLSVLATVVSSALYASHGLIQLHELLYMHANHLLASMTMNFVDAHNQCNL